ncbi:carbohydrate-binding family 9-like protein [Horticoccus sp. 23ND18S-11]|uniref:carbohydrate-binding family 9-like protein n=1 Tax=Horticoccus sp. 23ND18S-11 TaxID=3391832 RepID=UPI0039C9B7E8
MPLPLPVPPPSISPGASARARTWFGCLLATIALPLTAAETPPPDVPPPSRIVVPKLSGALTIDGKLDEPVWARAAVLPGFQRNDGSGREREATTVRIWYDDTALHLGWTCRDADIQATFTARDSKFWEEEVVEFFVAPTALARYFELQWNPLGGVFDAIINNDLDARGLSKKITGEWDFTAEGMRSAVTRSGTVADSTDRDEFWQVEVALPFAALKQSTPKVGDTWRANFYRYNREPGKPAELVSWSPTRLPSFHQPSRFGTLEFGR